jgi:hypothetical protein
VGLLGLALAVPSALADGYSRSVKDVPQPCSWTGLYIGMHVGLVTGEATGEVGLGAISTDLVVPGTDRS